MALRGDKSRLFGMTGILLLDGDGEPQPAAAGWMRPDAFHLRHTRGFELIPHRTRAVSAAVERIIVRRNSRDRAEQDRVVAVHECFDADRRLLLETAGIVPRPFAERTFVEQIVRVNETFKRDFRVRRNWQAGARPRDHLNRFTDQPARRVEFVPAIGNFQPGDHEQSGMYAADHSDRTGLAAFVIASADEIAVLAFRAHHRCGIARLRLHAIGAVIDPAGIRIAHDHHVAGADIVTAVLLVPARDGDFENVDIGAGQDVSITGPSGTVAGAMARASFM